MRLPGALMPHKVQVRAAAGYRAGGQSFDPPKPQPVPEVRAYVEDKNRVVRNGTGQEVTSTTAVYLDLEVNAPELSEVTYRTRRRGPTTKEVVAVSTFDHPRTPSHQVVYLA